MEYSQANVHKQKLRIANGQIAGNLNKCASLPLSCLSFPQTRYAISLTGKSETDMALRLISILSRGLER
jgi:hypothetical protein